MDHRLTFPQKLAGAFGLLVVLAVAVAVVGVYALREVVVQKDDVIDLGAHRLVEAEQLHAQSFRKAAESRGYLMTGDPQYLQAARDARARFRDILAQLETEVRVDEARRLLQVVDRAEAEHDRALQAIMATRGPTGSLDAIAQRLEREVIPIRQRLNEAVDTFIAFEERLLKERRDAATAGADRASRMVLVLAAAAVVCGAALALLLARALARQITGAVRHVQSSSAELQAAAGQQATGAKQQATAMAEITTTITELLATSRQIAQSAQRVAAVAADTAAAARGGDETVQRSHELIGAIRRQMELIVNHMLELGRKSQQVGGILEVVNELAEQTNILAINATIEAAGAGEAGRRFAVVAEEIRKLADRVGGSTKDIRTLIDEVRTAVNTTVMATESGSKTVEAGARQSSEVAAAFAHIARLVATTTDAAREIELSTKQQTTAVEQVNMAIGNVAQATREAEASSGQSLQTASQLANMSRDLARLVQAEAA